MKDLPHAPERAHQRVDLVASVVHRQRCARGRGHAEAIHDRLRAVMTGADGDALAIHDRPDVVRVHPVEHERQDAGLPPRRADQAQSVDRGERGGPVLQKALLVPAIHEKPIDWM